MKMSAPKEDPCWEIGIIIIRTCLFHDDRKPDFSSLKKFVYICIFHPCCHLAEVSGLWSSKKGEREKILTPN